MLNRRILNPTILILFLAACAPKTVPTAVIPEAPAVPTTASTATQEPPRTMVICLGEEPQTLYPYGGSSRSMWGVLEAVYDGPFDTRGFSVQPVILQHLPSLTNGDAAIQSVTVQQGDVVQSADGNIVTLEAGIQVYPAGCRENTCAITWDGTTPLQMEQVSAAFRLLPDLKWSDGEPLQAADSIYSFNLSSNPATPVSREVVYRTESYEALDDLTVLWKGIPGYLPQVFETNFWMPLPEHAWKDLDAKDLLTAPVSTESPLGWGPYVIEEWVKGDHITLGKNPNYFRAAEGLPKYEKLVYRFLGEAGDNNLAGLLAGECDVVDQTTLLDEQLEPVMEMQRDGKLKAYIGQGPEFELLAFGIRPSSYDDAYNPYGVDRPDVLGDVRTRQAVAACIDRAGFVKKPLMDQTSVPGGFFPPSHPLFLADLVPQPYDPATGIRLLEETGWLDADNDPATPRTAAGVANVPDGTPLALTYKTSQAPLRVEYGQKIAQSLAQCGIQVSVETLNSADLYKAGPEGALFGRNFDLAQFAWEVGRSTPCWIFESNQVPAQANNWVGVNVSGYINPAYDAACDAARLARPEDADYGQKQEAVQRLFSQELPVLPLYFRMHMTVSRPDFCGLEVDVTSRSPLWNLEEFAFGSNCSE